MMCYSFIFYNIICIPALRQRVANHILFILLVILFIQVGDEKLKQKLFCKSEEYFLYRI